MQHTISYNGWLLHAMQMPPTGIQHTAKQKIPQRAHRCMQNVASSPSPLLARYVDGYPVSGIPPNIPSCHARDNVVTTDVEASGGESEGRLLNLGERNESKVRRKGSTYRACVVE